MKNAAKEALREALKEELEEREEDYGDIVTELTSCKCLHMYIPYSALFLF